MKEHNKLSLSATAGRLQAPKHLLPSLTEFCQAGSDREATSLAQLTIALLPASSLKGRDPDSQQLEGPLQAPDPSLVHTGNDPEPQDFHEPRLESRVGSETSRESNFADSSDKRKEWAALDLAFARSRDDASKERIVCSMGHFLANLDWGGEANQYRGILDSFLGTVQTVCSPAEAPSVRFCGQQALQQSG